MQQFLLLIREDLKQRAGMTAERFDRNVQEMRAWIDAMASTGNFLDASALHNTGTYVGKASILSDGPFIEAKESISGFILIRAEDLKQASELANRCPLVHNGTDAIVEVRPILPERTR